MKLVLQNLYVFIEKNELHLRELSNDEYFIDCFLMQLRNPYDFLFKETAIFHSSLKSVRSK